MTDMGEPTPELELAMTYFGAEKMVTTFLSWAHEYPSMTS